MAKKGLHPNYVCLYCVEYKATRKHFIINNFISRSIWVNEFVMVEVSKVFQRREFQSLCHDLLFHCRFPFVFCLWYFKQTVNIIIIIILLFIVFLMFCSMVKKCMTQWKKFSVFWQQAYHVEIYIVLINTTNQVR